MNDSLARRVWERRDLLGWLLWLLLLPLSFLYFLGVRIRDLLYSLGWMPTRSLPCAVVSVGNLTVGGTGKTPTTVWLAQELGKRGYKVAILSRGYKRTGRGPMVLEPGSRKSASFGQGEDLLDAGDEPFMMGRVFGQRVGVGEKRYEVGDRMLRDARVDVFLLDDGFQHRQLRRDLDLLLLGSDWNGWLLPAGPFREPRSALHRADLYLVTGAREEWKLFLRRFQKSPTIFFGSLQPKGLLTLDGGQCKERPLGLLVRSKILTVSAIADPAPFYRMIHDWEGEIVDSIEFPDHHCYSAKDWQRINRAARNVDYILTTEKDILKLACFPFAREKLLALRVEMVVENGGSLVRAVEEAIQNRQRSN
jgi:tetraacyldisaccharide 4'-kinase